MSSLTWLAARQPARPQPPAGATTDPKNGLTPSTDSHAGEEIDNATQNKPERRWGHIRKRPGGKFQASYVGPDLVRHCAPKAFTARMDAEGWLRDERRLAVFAATAPAHSPWGDGVLTDLGQHGNLLRAALSNQSAEGQH